MVDARLSIPIGTRRLEIRTGDITAIPADAIGNAANAQLRGGTGVNGAIHRAGGPAIMRELNSIRQHIGHCLPGAAEVLRSCYSACVRLADSHGIESLTLPAISTGVYGYPLQEAADVAVSEIVARLRCDTISLERVSFVLFGAAPFRAFATAALRQLS